MPRANNTTFESKLAKDAPFPTSSHTRFGVVWVGSYGRSKSGSRGLTIRGGGALPRPATIRFDQEPGDVLTIKI